MYRALNQILDVKNFAVSNDEIIIRFCNGSIQINNMDITSINSNFRNIHFVHLNKIFYWCTTRNGNFLLNNKFDIIKEYPSTSVYWDEIVLESKDLKLYSSTIEFEKNGEVIYDLEIRNLRTNSGFFEIGKKNILAFNYLIVNKFVFSTNEKNSQIHAYTLPTAQPLWQFSLANLPNAVYDGKEEPARVDQFLGVYGQTLWVQLNGYRLLGLDMATGRQLHLIPGFRKGYGDNYLDQKTGVVKMLAGHWYLEFDLRLLKYTLEKKIDANGQFFVRSGQFYENDPNIYFCGSYKEPGFPNCFGTYSTRTYGVEWYKLSEKGEYYFDPPQAADQKLYVLDSKKTLHIFQKENA